MAGFFNSPLGLELASNLDQCGNSVGDHPVVFDCAWYFVMGINQTASPAPPTVSTSDGSGAAARFRSPGALPLRNPENTVALKDSSSDLRGKGLKHGRGVQRYGHSTSA